MDHSIQHIRIATLFIATILLCCSLKVKCYCTSLRCSDSVDIFFMGWRGVFSGGAGFVWIANPMLLTSCVLTWGNSNYAIYISAITLVMCLSFLCFDKGLDDHTERAFYFKITELKAGYWLWTGGAFSLFAGNFITHLNRPAGNSKQRFLKSR